MGEARTEGPSERGRTGPATGGTAAGAGAPAEKGAPGADGASQAGAWSEPGERTPPRLGLPPLGRRQRYLLAAILLVGLALRLGLILEQRADILFDHPVLDEQRYVDAARALEAGRADARQPWWQPPGIIYALMTVFRLTGPDLLVPRVLQALLSVACCFLLFAIGRRLLGASVGLAAAAILALHGVVVFESFELLPPTWILFCDLLAVHLLLLAREARSWRLSLGAGLALGASAVFSPVVLPFAAVAALWLRPRSLVAPLLAGLLLPILPVTWQNHQRSGELVLVSTNGGLNFYLGNNARYRETFALRPGHRWEALTGEPGRHGVTKPGAASGYFVGKGLAHFRDAPLEASARLARKLYLVFNGVEIPRDSDLYAMRRDSVVLRVLVGPRAVPWPDGLLLPLAALSFVLCWPARRRLWLAYGFLATHVAVLALFFVSSRHRVPTLAFFALFAAAGVAAAWRRWPSWSWRSRGLTLGACALLLVLTNLPTWETRLSFAGERDFYRGLAWRDSRDEPARALAAFRRAAKTRPGDPRIWYELGGALARRGQAREAEAAWDRVAQLDPWESRAFRRAAVSASRRGELRLAVKRLQALLSAARRPAAHYAEDHLTLAFLLARLGESEPARRHLRAAAQADRRRARESLPVAIQAALASADVPDAAFWLAVGDQAQAFGQARLARRVWAHASTLPSDSVTRQQLERRLGPAEPP